MSANPMAELGHADLADPDVADAPDEHVDADLTWGPGLSPAAAAEDVAVRPWLLPPPPVVGVSAAEHARGFFARQRDAKAAQEASAQRRRTLRPPAPEIPATPLTRAQAADRGASAAVLLLDAATAAGWTTSASYARGPMPTEKTLCSICTTWQIVTKAGALKVHGPIKNRCPQIEPDPASPDYQIVDSIIVRALSPRGHRLAAVWVDAGDDPDKPQYAADGCQLWHVGDRSRAVDVVAVRGVLKAIGAARKPKRAPGRSARARRTA